MALGVKPFHRRSSSGVTRIVRDTYNSGTKNGWWEIRAAVIKRDQGKCQTCGLLEEPRKGIHHNVHHIRELSKGGTSSMSNLITLCKDCHERKHKHLR